MDNIFKLINVFFEIHRKRRHAISLTNKNRLNEVDKLKMEWARQFLQDLRINIDIRGSMNLTAPLLVGNHISYLDIPVLMSSGAVRFVAKEEVRKWPYIGASAQTIGTLFVNRSSSQSRAQVKKDVADSIRTSTCKTVIFPSGTTSINEHVPWRKGAFEIAYENKIMVQPFRLAYSNQRLAAYVDDDIFLNHLLNVIKTNGLHAELEFGDPQYITDPAKDCERIWLWSRLVSSTSS